MSSWSQTTIYVNQSIGNDSNIGINLVNVPPGTGPKKTIQAAVNAISFGGTVIVTDNATYYEQIVITNKQVHLQTTANPTLEAPTNLNKCASCVILTFGNGSTNSSVTGFKFRLDASKLRRAVFIAPNVRNIQIQNNDFDDFTPTNTTGYPGSSPNNRVMLIDMINNSSAQIVNNILSLDEQATCNANARAINMVLTSSLNGGTVIRNNQIRCIGTQDIALDIAGRTTIESNVFSGGQVAVQVFTADSTTNAPGGVSIKGNTFNDTYQLGERIHVQLRDCRYLAPVFVTVDSNTFHLGVNARTGIDVQGSREVFLTRNTFYSTGNQYNFILVDNRVNSSSPYGRPTGVTIWGNQFLANHSGNAITFKKNSSGNDYVNVILTGPQPNVYSNSIDYFIDCQANLGSIVQYISADISSNQFPLSDNFAIEDKIIHRLDDNTGINTRPVITWIPKNVWVTNTTIGGNNESIQYAIDAIPTGSNDCVVNIKSGFYSADPLITINKPLTFFPENGTTIQGNLNVNLPFSSTAVTQAGTFNFNGSNFTVTNGDWNLNGKNIIFSSSSLLAESPGQTIKGDSGYIQISRVLNGPSNTNVGGFGARVTSGASWGMTTVRRGHAEQTTIATGSIKRYFDIIPTNNSNLNATLQFNYDHSELNGFTAGTLNLHKSDNGGLTYSNVGGTNGVSSITLTGIQSMGRWTASSNYQAPQIQILTAQPHCQGDTVHLRLNNGGYSSFLWSNGQTTSQIAVTQSGSYWCITQHPNGITDTSDTVTINFLPLPNATISASGP
ncbi:MAG: hypothetical protein NZ108_02340, partial [Bacteroidia bacterium]|nr:hypothetical protein [Bacteroidia bacterium]